ncbi:HET-domain-containing protein [Cadophora sp. DSE1049]|nr:HET-domain-containing protein [Cadophora sp. DSE1049]
MDSFESSNAIQQSLCLRCKQLDIMPMFLAEDEAVPATGKAIISLGKQSQRVNCDMCRFFLELSPNYMRNHKQHVRLFDHIRQSSLDPNLLALMDLRRTRFLSVLRENATLQYDYSIKDEIVQSGVIVYLPTDLPAPSPVHSINAATVDFGLLSSLIEHCQSSHSLCTQVEVRCSLPYIYLINCAEERVVREHPNQKYLALSYVWGQPNSQESSQNVVEETWPEDSFSFSEAPLTIQDAIRVVRNLGRNYLWVDRYCINQNGGLEKKTMLQNMDQIYENAEATIVALYGENGGAGLPGVSRVSRRPQPCLQTSRGSLVSSCPPVSTLIQTSRWATRGWTYQEARLSKRCLFFTEHQVYVVCRVTTRSEAVPSESQSCWISTLLNSSRLDGGLFGPQTSIANGFCRDRLAFSQRTLSYESDILDAFRGILNRSPFFTFWGVPITPPKAAMDPHTGLALGLLWTRTPSWAISRHLVSRKEPPRIRRVNFPTWSWTSITSEIFNEGYGSQSVYGAYLEADDRVSNRSDAYIRFWIYVGGKQVPLDEVMQQQQHSTILPEDSPFLLVQGDLVRLTLTNGKQPYRVWGCEHLSLEFWAVFDLDRDIAADSPQDGDQGSLEDALILVDWNDSQKKTKKRFVLMLLRWVGGGRAERRGLLSDYRKEYDAEELRRVPRTRKMFILQ